MEPSRFFVVDFMHSMYLGICKKVLILVKRKYLTKNEFAAIQQSIDEMIIPPNDVGRIPRKINTKLGFSMFTADDYKNFMVFYSALTLRYCAC